MHACQVCFMRELSPALCASPVLKLQTQSGSQWSTAPSGVNSATNRDASITVQPKPRLVPLEVPHEIAARF